jgi:hypothetical protein
MTILELLRPTPLPAPVLVGADINGDECECPPPADSPPRTSRDNRCLYNLVQPGTEREQRDDQLRCVPERDFQGNILLCNVRERSAALFASVDEDLPTRPNLVLRIWKRALC